MEPTAAGLGGPFEFQLAMATNCWPGAEEAPAADDAQVWAAPACGLPLEYASIVDIFGSSCSLQPYNYVVPASSSSSSSSGGQQQLVNFNYYAATAQHHDMTVNGTATQEDEDPLERYVENPKKLFEEKKEKLDAAYNYEDKFLKRKMHRYPASIKALDKDGLYTIPRVVAIGPYHYGGENLKQAEEVKHAAAWHCMEKSGLDVPQLYHVVVSIVAEIKARDLYDKDVMADISDDDFQTMMFFDACFLVMYMLKKSGLECNRELSDFFDSAQDSIAHDIMLLENQIPWPVVGAVMDKIKDFTLERKEEFIARWKEVCLQDRVSADDNEFPHLVWDEGYKPPHLLGLLRLYMVGEITSRSRDFEVLDSDFKKLKTINISAGAIELAEMGIDLTANETRELQDMDLSKKWIILAKLSMAPLSLSNLRASQLVNMAALELCTTPDFFDDEAEIKDSVVCSYLLLLSMLVHREADVHELRAKGILQGAGLSNNKTLDLLTSLHSLPQGRCHGYVMVKIAVYRMSRWPGWLTVYGFIYRNFEYMTKVGSAIGLIVGLYKLIEYIIATTHHHH